MTPTLRNRCQLITYPDSLGGTIETLSTLLDGPLAEAIGGIHILPFFPSSGDRGFAPISYHRVDPAFGTWRQIEQIAQRHDLVVDCVINHISRESEYLQDFLKRHVRSDYASLFIRWNQFWQGEPTSEEMGQIYTRKPRPPWVEVRFADGHYEKLWCTFGSDQIDLNLTSARTRALIRDTLHLLCDRGAMIIRLDAFAYTIKKRGSSCFFVEPDIWELLTFVTESIASYHALLLPEVHEEYRLQLKLAERGYWVYDFALPLLILQAIFDTDGDNLKHWLTICPRRQFTTLDTHDGIGVVDVLGLMPDETIKRIRERLLTMGAGATRLYGSEGYDNFDLYQINCTYYSALGSDDAYLAARAIQLFAPGIPQIYYVGLLAGRNDIETFKRTRQGRDINRHNYSMEEIETELKRPVVVYLLRLMEFRNRHPAFDGDTIIDDTPPHIIGVLRQSDGHHAKLTINLRTMQGWIDYDDNGVTRRMTIGSTIR